MRELTLIYILFFSILHLSAQDLHIYYNAQTELLKYESEGKPIPQAKAQSGSTIFLHIENYNNYLYDVEITANETTINIPASSSNMLTDLFSGKGAGLSALNFSLGDAISLPASYEEIIEEPELSYEVEERGAEVAKAEKMSAKNQIVQQFRGKFTQTLTMLEEKEKELIYVEKEIKQIFREQQGINIMAKEIKKLKQHPQLKPEQIKQMSMEYFQQIFGEGDKVEIDVEEYLKAQVLLPEMLNVLKEKQKAYQKVVNNLGGLKKNLTNSDLSQLFLESWKKRVADSEEFLEKVQSDQQELSKLTSELQKDDTQYLADLRYEYEALKNNDFSYTYRTNAKEDAIIFNIKFRKKESTDKIAISNKTVAPIEVAVSGGFKLNASLGLSFGGFSKTPQDYYVREETIKADDKGDLKPLLTSFLHFYKQSKGNTSFGGSVGIGFPIAGNNNITSLSFLAGPALVIGKGSRIVISGGLMAGQVERLAQGYQIGDTFISEVDNVPVKQKYELGYFLGMSYNLK